jgi:hypothetical protein
MVAWIPFSWPFESDASRQVSQPILQQLYTRICGNIGSCCIGVTSPFTSEQRETSRQTDYTNSEEVTASHVIPSLNTLHLIFCVLKEIDCQYNEQLLGRLITRW